MITLIIIGIVIAISTTFGMGHTGNPMRRVHWLPFIEKFGSVAWIVVMFYLFGKKFGGIAFLISTITAFYFYGWKFGVAYLLGIFIIGAIADSFIVKPFFKWLSNFLIKEKSL